MISKARYTKVSIRNEQRLDKKFANRKCTVNFRNANNKSPTTTESATDSDDKNRNLSETAELSATADKKSNSDKNFKAISEQFSIQVIPYSLYIYRKELQRRRLHLIRLSEAKVHLTDDLISKTIYNCLANDYNCPQDDANILAREMFYKTMLEKRIKRVEEYLKKKAEQKKKDAQKEKQEEGISNSNLQVHEQCDDEMLNILL